MFFCVVARELTELVYAEGRRVFCMSHGLVLPMQLFLERRGRGVIPMPSHVPKVACLPASAQGHAFAVICTGASANQHILFQQLAASR